MESAGYFSLSLLFLLGTAFLNASQSAVRVLHLRDPKRSFSEPPFFYGLFQRLAFRGERYDELLFAFICSLNITRLLFGASAILCMFQLLPIFTNSFWADFAFLGSLFVLLSLLIGEYLPRVFGLTYPSPVYKFSALVASLFLTATLPITWMTLKLLQLLFGSFHLDYFEGPLTKTKQEIIEMIHKTELTPHMTEDEKQLIESVLTFKDRIAREIMVPRVDLFSLSSDTPIREAARLIDEEGYSRIPVYEENVDNIVGVVMYKDIIKKYMEFAKEGGDRSLIEAPLKEIQKPVFYIPETKKISVLLQEFRKRQIHLAIVVDEYGGTEGIVTIEDILEEIVGEISDEYDEDEELYIERKEGHFIVDARMSILDADEQLGVKIPQEGDYDTIGGYIFHSTGTIPPKGLIIHHENFDLEILSSDERRVERVLIKNRDDLFESKDDDDR